MKTSNSVSVSGSAKMMASALALMGLLAVGPASVHANPVDPVSNPDNLTYSDVEMKIPDYDVPFKRYGAVSDPSIFKKVAAGVPAGKVSRLLGEPRSRTEGPQGPEWNYNFTLVMPESKNYLVCQYKVVFDGEQQVKETVWRRHQCLEIADGTAVK